MSVQRYNVKGWNDDQIEIADNDGTWVRFTDHEAIVKELEAQRDQIAADMRERAAKVLKGWQSDYPEGSENYEMISACIEAIRNLKPKPESTHNE